MAKEKVSLVKKEEEEIKPLDHATVEALVFEGDLAKLNPTQRVLYYNNVCQSLGLNPATKPFGYIKLNQKLVLYALRNCTDQLTSTRGISTEILDEKLIEDLLTVKVRAWTKDGRQTVDIGVISIKGLYGDAKANALMKAHTKAKRRAVLSLVGLSFPDETEVESIPGAQRFPDAQLPAVVPSRDASEDEMDLKPPYPVEEESQEIPDDVFPAEAKAGPPTAQEIAAIKDAWRKKAIPAVNAAKILQVYTEGRKSTEWTREDFNALRDFLKDVFVEPVL